jgi:GNAT superfamily N-acetyltransferase
VPADIRLKEESLLLRTGSWDEVGSPARAIRRRVFQGEQEVAREHDEDGDDKDCVHFVIQTSDGVDLGTARMHGNRMGRLAVVPEARRQGVGFLLVAAMLREAFVQGFDSIWGYAQPGSLGLASLFGFDIEPEVVVLAGLSHHRVVKKLERLPRAQDENGHE